MNIFRYCKTSVKNRTFHTTLWNKVKRTKLLQNAAVGQINNTKLVQKSYKIANFSKFGAKNKPIGSKK